MIRGASDAFLGPVLRQGRQTGYMLAGDTTELEKQGIFHATPSLPFPFFDRAVSPSANHSCLVID